MQRLTKTAPPCPCTSLYAERGSHSIAAPSWLSIWRPGEFYRLCSGSANPAQRCQLLAHVVEYSEVQTKSMCCSGLTPAGVAHSWVLGTAVYSAFGARGYALVCLYFILGSAVRLCSSLLAAIGCSVMHSMICVFSVHAHVMPSVCIFKSCCQVVLKTRAPPLWQRLALCTGNLTSG